MRRNKFVRVGLFTKVEMRRDGVLEEVNDEVTDQYQERSLLPCEGQALRNDFDGRRRQHEPRSQRDKILQVGALPVFLDNHHPAKHIGRSRCQAQQQTEKYRVHGKKSRMITALSHQPSAISHSKYDCHCSKLQVLEESVFPAHLQTLRLDGLLFLTADG